MKIPHRFYSPYVYFNEELFGIFNRINFLNMRWCKYLVAFTLNDNNYIGSYVIIFNEHDTRTNQDMYSYMLRA